jgi:hypothetical protein
MKNKIKKLQESQEEARRESLASKKKFGIQMIQEPESDQKRKQTEEEKKWSGREQDEESNASNIS